MDSNNVVFQTTSLPTDDWMKKWFENFWLLLPLKYNCAFSYYEVLCSKNALPPYSLFLPLFASKFGRFEVHCVHCTNRQPLLQLYFVLTLDYIRRFTASWSLVKQQRHHHCIEPTVKWNERWTKRFIRSTITAL